MMTIAEHSVDIDMLPPRATILDLGCRGFIFSTEMERMGHHVVAVDIDKLETNKQYFQVAIAGYDGLAGILHDKDPQATRITMGGDVPCYTIESFSYDIGIDLWDVIKMDIEGSEYEVIMSMDKPMAKQLSIEFHLHTGIYKQKEVDEMVNSLTSLGYDTRQHELTDRHCAGLNYWDSLFCLK